MSIDYNLIGKRIQKSRKAAKMTQENLAEMMNVSVVYISQIERGVTKASLTTLDSICQCINCDLIYILFGVSQGENINFSNDFAREFLELSDKK